MREMAGIMGTYTYNTTKFLCNFSNQKNDITLLDPILHITYEVIFVFNIFEH